MCKYLGAKMGPTLTKHFWQYSCSLCLSHCASQGFIPSEFGVHDPGWDLTSGDCAS